MTIPGMQNPHWLAPVLWKAFCTAVSSPGRARPSTVSMLAPCAFAAGIRHDFTSRPPTNTEHVPHSPAPHPSFVPVSCSSSRKTSSKRRPGSTRRETGRPLTSRVSSSSGIRHSPLSRTREKPRHCARAPLRSPPARSRAPHSGGTRYGCGRADARRGTHARALDEFCGGRLSPEQGLCLGKAHRPRSDSPEGKTDILEPLPSAVHPHQGGATRNGNDQGAALPHLLEGAAVPLQSIHSHGHHDLARAQIRAPGTG